MVYKSYGRGGFDKYDLKLLQIVPVHKISYIPQLIFIWLLGLVWKQLINQPINEVVWEPLLMIIQVKINSLSYAFYSRLVFITMFEYYFYFHPLLFPYLLVVMWNRQWLSRNILVRLLHYFNPQFYLKHFQFFHMKIRE